MYHRTLRIALFGLADAAAEALMALEPFDRFQHDFERFGTLDVEAFVTCDIAILDAAPPRASDSHEAPGDPATATLLPSRDLASLVAKRRQQHAGRFGAFAVAAPASITQCWSAADYALVDAVWPAPLEPARAAFEFARLQQAARQQAELCLARTYLDTAIDSTPELIWFKDAHGAHLKVNDAFCATVEKTKEQVEGRGHYYIWDITPDEYAQGEYVCLESEGQTMAAGRTCLFDEQVKTKRGMRQFKTYKSPLFDDDGTIMGTVGIAHDVTDLGNIETELELFTNSMPYAVVVLDHDNVIRTINERAEEYFAVKREEVLGDDFDRWRRLVLSDAVVDAHDFADGSLFSAVIAGVEKTFEVNQRLIHDVFGNVTGELRIYRDVTKEHKLEQRVLETARTDYLTGLYNRRRFYELMEGRPHEDPCALVSLDLDDFKAVNDRCGHAVGDRMLQRTAALLREVFPDCPCIRWGGDEFIVAALGETSVTRIGERTRELLERLAAGPLADGLPALTGSAGIAVGDSGLTSVDELVKRSDEALYRAKRAGKSQCCLHEEG